MNRCVRSAAFAAAVLLAGPSAASGAPPPRVLVSVSPLYALAAAVTGDVTTPTLLVRRVASPHAYPLRPSDIRSLQEADLVVWVGPVLEAFLVRPLSALDPRVQRIEASTLDGMVLHPARTGGAWGGEGDGGHGHGGEVPAGTAKSARLDPHLWLDPRNAERLVEAIAWKLEALDPGRATHYRRNAAAAIARIREADARFARRLAAVRDRPFVVFHDAYQYLERRYGLAAVGAVTVSPERMPGARRIIELRERIATLGARCVFREPQFRPALIDTLVEGTQARTGVLDPLGSDIALGASHWTILMERNVDALLGCLAR